MERLLIISMLFVAGSLGFRYGPPQDACTTMFPSDHGTDARMDDPPFTVSVSSNHYTPNQEITVTIDSAATDPDNATREWFMEGLLVQARLANCQSPTPIGTFMVPDCDNFLQVIDCSGVKMGAVRHYTHLHIYSKNFTWKAPAQAAGHVYISATIARNKERFWMNVHSDTIMDTTDTSIPKTCDPLQTKYVPKSERTNAASHLYISVVTILAAVVGSVIFV